MSDSTPKSTAFALIYSIAMVADSFITFPKLPVIESAPFPLRGKVLPVGGIKEKILAAKRANVKEIVLCEDNRKDILEIKESYLKGLTFHYVSEMKEVIDIALTKQKVKNAKKLVS